MADVVELLPETEVLVVDCDADVTMVEDVVSARTDALCQFFYKCPHCDLAFSSSADLSAHSVQHSKRFQCRFCPKNFTTKKSLNEHENIHTGEKPYRCKVCDQSYKQSGQLSKHMKIHGVKQHKCSQCDSVFLDKDELIQHRKTHAKIFVCASCGKTFTRLHQLGIHQRIHTGVEKPHACEHCGKRFHRNNDLRKHLRIHTGEKPYRCETCSRTFTYRHTLLQHSCSSTLSSQTSEVTSEESDIVSDQNSGVVFVCELCEKRFDRLDLLSEHLSVHSCDLDRMETANDNSSGNSSYPIAGLAQEYNEDNANNSENHVFECGLCSRLYSTMEEALNHGCDQSPSDDNDVHEVDNDKSVFDEDTIELKDDADAEITEDVIHPEGAVSADSELLNSMRKIDAVDEEDIESSISAFESKDIFANDGEDAVVIIRHSIDDNGDLILRVNKNDLLNDEIEFTNDEILDCELASTDALSNSENSIDDVNCVDNNVESMAIKEVLDDICQKDDSVLCVEQSPEILSCSYCNDTFKSSVELEEHNLSHCSFCPKCKRLVKSASMNDLLCDSCKEADFVSCEQNQDFVDSMEISSNVEDMKKQRYCCEICGKTFNRQFYLQVHAKRHSGELPWQCLECELCCTSQENLLKHVLSHFKKKPHQCPHCDKCFASSNTLKEHINVHTRARPYSCRFCSKSYRQRGHKIAHERTHTGDKPFSCAYCDYTTVWRSSYKWHLNNKHSKTVLPSVQETESGVIGESDEILNEFDSSSTPVEGYSDCPTMITLPESSSNL